MLLRSSARALCVLGCASTYSGYIAALPRAYTSYDIWISNAGHRIAGLVELHPGVVCSALFTGVSHLIT